MCTRPGPSSSGWTSGASLAAICERVRAELSQAHIVIELGRYLVGEAGVYIARVVDRNVSRGQVQGFLGHPACIEVLV